MSVEVNPLGPVHEYDNSPVVFETVIEIVPSAFSPSQYVSVISDSTEISLTLFTVISNDFSIEASLESDDFILTEYEDLVSKSNASLFFFKSTPVVPT